MHIVVVPWLAMGHIIPYHRLSICLARRGHRVSFLSTPRNLQRLPPAPKTLAHLITLVPLPLIHSHSSLPLHAESSCDITYPKHQILKLAFDSVEPTVVSFLTSSSPPPDWIVTDFSTHWLPGLARRHGIRSVYFSPFFAMLLVFFDSSKLDEGWLTIEDLTRPPSHQGVPRFMSNFAFRPYEIAKYVQRSQEFDSHCVPDVVRYAVTMRDSDLLAVRTCPEFEHECFGLLSQTYRKPVLPIGLLPSVLADDDDEDMEDNEKQWDSMRKWLDKHPPSSVVYVALGTEAELTAGEVESLALGLEQTGLPFFWVLRDPPESTRTARDMLPNGFEERVDGQGVICTEWAPQVRILSHGSVGGFLTHCGCNSIIEGLAFGRVLIMLPMVNDQGLNARLMREKRFGVEVERDERDGWFTPGSVAEAVILAMVSEAGEALRASAKEAMGLFGSRERNDRYVDEFVRYLEEHLYREESAE
ncbi:hypothetical protein SAY86_020331 [Trapa natans]|uniref:Glycosyltransferase n=1 Tax=Trapa natans TaxID=22666 RepID=A0AAN7LMQ6_TRANT|nr:hypothetical protein SAY86_020331 [Trapa natans]